jgi:tripartite-type tricarboxylate transporter receptor subunit TctC
MKSWSRRSSVTCGSNNRLGRQTNRRPPLRAAIALAVSLLLGGSSAVRAEDVAAFYAGKQISFVAPTSAGGGFDLYSRLFAESVRKFIPGQPSIVVQNMPGAGGMRAAGYVFNIAPKDGTVIGMPLANIPLSEALEPTVARYQSAKFSWIGTITPETDILGVWKTAGIASLYDAQKKEIIIGATGKLGLLALNVNLCNALLGTKFKVVLGYPSGNEVNMAMETNEVQGRTNQWTSWKSQRPEWIKDKRLNFLLQIGPREAELPNVPAFLDLVKTPKDQAMVRLLQSNQTLGRSVYAPPGIPKERLLALREAFEKTVRDPEFLARIEAAGLNVQPLSGAALDQEMSRSMDNVGEAGRDLAQALKL